VWRDDAQDGGRGALFAQAAVESLYASGWSPEDRSAAEPRPAARPGSFA
jgi:hypothetical protein